MISYPQYSPYHLARWPSLTGDYFHFPHRGSDEVSYPILVQDVGHLECQCVGIRITVKLNGEGVSSLPPFTINKAKGVQQGACSAPPLSAIFSVLA